MAGEPLDPYIIERIRATQAAHGLHQDTALPDLARLRHIETEKPTVVGCFNCGAMFAPRDSQNKYCSPGCRRAASRKPARKPVPRECVQCGRAYVPKTANHIYCGAACRYAAAEALERQRRAVLEADRLASNLKTFAPVKRIQQIVADTWRTPVWEMWSSCRKRYVTWPRFAAMALVRELLGLSTPTIARVFGNRDHTSAMHGIRRCAEMRAENKKYARLYAEAEAKCRAALEPA